VGTPAANAAVTTNKLLRNASAGPEDYVFTAGDSVYGQGTVDPADAKHKTRSYRFAFRDPSGATRSTTACTANPRAGGAVFGSYAIQPSDPVSAATGWSVVLSQYTDKQCTKLEASSGPLAFHVAKASVYGDEGLTAPQAFVGPGGKSYVTAAGLTPGQQDWSATWVAPGAGDACANTGGTDRPDSDAGGLLPPGTGSFLRYPPGSTGAEWNLDTAYDAACPPFGAANDGRWALRLQRDATHVVSLPAFSVDAKAPTSGASSPATSRSSSFTVSYTASDPGGGSGLDRVDLYAKGPTDSAYSKVATDATPGGSGSFSYKAPDDPSGQPELGDYRFYTVATDKAENAEAAPTGADGDTVTKLDTAPPSSAATSPSTSAANGFQVSYTAADEPGGSGLAQVDLYAKAPGDTDYAKVATDSTPGASGSFDYTAAKGNGDYAFYTVATDQAGHAEAPPAVPPDATTAVTVTSTANFRYVAKNNPACSDSGPGTAAQPYCSIRPAAAAAKAGDTVQVGSGTYGEAVTVASSGTASAPVTFTAAPGATPKLTGAANGFSITGLTYVTVAGFEVTATTADGIVVKSSSHVTLRDNHVSFAGQPANGATAKGIRLEGTSDSTVEGNTVDHNTDFGIYLLSGSTRNEIVSNRVASNARVYTRAASGIRLYSAPGNTISSNVSHDNEDSGIESYTGANNETIVNNVTYANGDHGIDNYQSAGQRIVSNVVNNNVTAGINLEGGSSGGSLANNASVDNGINSPRTSGDIRVDSTSTSGTAIDYDIVNQRVAQTTMFQWGSGFYYTLADLTAATGQEAHGRQADPLWTAPASGDFRLRAGSPAIDSANSGASAELDKDADGSPRRDDAGTPNTGVGPRAYDDRGAYEY